MAVIEKNKYGITLAIVDCDDMEEAISVKIAWEKNTGGIAEITMMEE